jgi:hypothetical protein
MAEHQQGLGAHLKAKKAARELEPIKYETFADGVGISSRATGTAAQLIAAGVITADHLPPGRNRHRYGRSETGPVSHWWIYKLSGGMVQVNAAHRNSRDAAERVRNARRELDWIEKTDHAEQCRSSPSALCRVGKITASGIRDRGDKSGPRLDAASATKLGAICDQLEALFREAQAVIDAASVETVQPGRDKYLRKLRSQCEYPMPALPAVEVESEETDEEVSHG